MTFPGCSHLRLLPIWSVSRSQQAPPAPTVAAPVTPRDQSSPLTAVRLFRGAHVAYLPRASSLRCHRRRRSHCPGMDAPCCRLTFTESQTHPRRHMQSSLKWGLSDRLPPAISLSVLTDSLPSFECLFLLRICADTGLLWPLRCPSASPTRTDTPRGPGPATQPFAFSCLTP